MAKKYYFTASALDLYSERHDQNIDCISITQGATEGGSPCRD